MPKRIKEDDGFYRVRRGKKVRIPDEWVGQVPTDQTIRKRQSKLTGKLKRSIKYVTSRCGATGPLYVEYLEQREALFDIE